MKEFGVGSVNNIKNYLYFRLQDMDELENEYKDICFNVEELAYILELLKDPFVNKMDIALNLEILYSRKEINRVMNLITFIEKIREKNIPYEKQYNHMIQSLKNVINKFHDDYKNILEQKEITKKKIISNRSYRKIFLNILYRFKYNQPITENQRELLSKYFDSEKLPCNTQVWYFEIIRLYNIKLYDKYLESPKIKYDILNMLKFGYEKYDEEMYDYDDETLDIIARIESIYSCGDVKAVIQSIDTFVRNDEKYLQVLTRLLNNLMDKIFNLSEFISDKDIYLNEEDKEIIVHDYKNMVEIYVGLRELYYKKKQSQDIEDKVETNEMAETNEMVEANEKKFVFSKSLAGNVYFLEDLKKMPKEKFAKVGRLLTDFKQNKLTKKHIQGFKDNYTDFRKLVDFQIRIMIKEIGDNTYCIYGVGEKKNQDGLNLYKKLSNRPSPNIDELDKLIQEGEQVYGEIMDYIDENAIILNKKGK